LNTINSNNNINPNSVKCNNSSKVNKVKDITRSICYNNYYFINYWKHSSKQDHFYLPLTLIGIYYFEMNDYYLFFSNFVGLFLDFRLFDDLGCSYLCFIVLFHLFFIISDANNCLMVALVIYLPTFINIKYTSCLLELGLSGSFCVKVFFVYWNCCELII